MPEDRPPYRLHVAIDRGKGPVYVLLHGINSTGHDWDTVVTAMGFDRRCIALDELGYGNSPKPLDIDYTVDDHADAIDHTLDRDRHRRAVHARRLLDGRPDGRPFRGEVPATSQASRAHQRAVLPRPRGDG